MSITDDYEHFSIKLYHSETFNESKTEYIGGKVDFFDMCSKIGMNMCEYDAMLGELGITLGDNFLWVLILGTGLPHGLFPIEKEEIS